MTDITGLMNAYRECSRNLWNVYFANQANVGAALDAFEQLRELLFDSLVVSELHLESQAESQDTRPPTLKVLLQTRSVMLVKRLSSPGQAGYWDQEKDMVVGPDDITLTFVDYFDFSQVPVKDLRYCLCKVLSFPSHVEYEGREVLLEATAVKFIHHEPNDLK